jgi:predicted  nucleic acid-binding Zn-ribbon protein
MSWHLDNCLPSADGDRSLRLSTLLEEVMAQGREARLLLREAASHLRRLLEARPWQKEMAALRRRIEELERERDALWQELWRLRERVEEAALVISLPERMALVRDEMAALGNELHRLARAIERMAPLLEEGQNASSPTPDAGRS